MPVDLPSFQFDVSQKVAHKTDAFTQYVVLSRSFTFDHPGDLSRPRIEYYCGDFAGEGKFFQEFELTAVSKPEEEEPQE